MPERAALHQLHDDELLPVYRFRWRSARIRWRDRATLAEATTPSLEALQAYSAALKEFDVQRRGSLLQRAVTLDPEFAVAHAQLGFNLGGRGEAALGRQSLIKAYQMPC
jgi:hypothetical protein